MQPRASPAAGLRTYVSHSSGLVTLFRAEMTIEKARRIDAQRALIDTKTGMVPALARSETLALESMQQPARSSYRAGLVFHPTG